MGFSLTALLKVTGQAEPSFHQDNSKAALRYKDTAGRSGGGWHLGTVSKPPLLWRRNGNAEVQIGSGLLWGEGGEQFFNSISNLNIPEGIRWAEGKISENHYLHFF